MAAYPQLPEHRLCLRWIGDSAGIRIASGSLAGDDLGLERDRALVQSDAPLM